MMPLMDTSTTTDIYLMSDTTTLTNATMVMKMMMDLAINMAAVMTMDTMKMTNMAMMTNTMAVTTMDTVKMMDMYVIDYTLKIKAICESPASYWCEG